MMMEEDEDVIFDQAGLLTNRVKPESEVQTVRSGFAAKALKTFCLCAAFFGLGLCIAIPGPTLLDLQGRTHTDLEHISRIFTGRSVGYLGGSILGGILFDFVNQECLLSFSLLLTAIGTAAAPWSTNYFILMGLFACQGVSMGFLDTGGNVLCLNIWGINSGPYVQALHFSFGVGAFVAPLIAEPFLAHIDLNATNFTMAQQHTPFDPNQPPELPGVKSDFAHDKSKKSKRSTANNDRFIRAVASAPNASVPSQAQPSGNKTDVKRPISSGTHLSDDPKVADGSKFGKEISKNEQNKQKEKTKEPVSDPEKTGISQEGMGEKNETAVNQSKGAAATSSSASPTTTTPTTTTKSTTTTTTKPTTTSKKPTSPPQSEVSKKVIVTGNFSVVNDASPATPPANSSTSGIKEVLKEKVGEIISYVGKMPDMMNEFTKVQFSFLIIAAILFVTALLFMVLCCCTTRTQATRRNAHRCDDYVIEKESRGFRVQILILLFVFYFLYVGMEVTYGGLIMTFSVKYLDWSKAEGTMLTSVFWGAFAVGRGMAIFLAKCLSPAIMLIADLVLSCLALAGLVMALDSNHYILWFCTGMLGVGMASIFPTGITWAERYMHVTGKATAVFVVGSALGEMALPALTGFLFQTGGPMWLLYIMLGCGILSAVLYIIMQNLATNKGERYVKLARRSSGGSLMNGVTPDLDTDDVELESVISDMSESSAPRGGARRKTTIHSEENHSFVGNGKKYSHAKENGTKHSKVKRGFMSGKISYKRI